MPSSRPCSEHSQRSLERKQYKPACHQGDADPLHGGEGLLEKKHGDHLQHAKGAPQAQGIDQVSKAITQIDAVTQHNSANAEEYASSAQELKAKSDEMKQFIADLRALIGIDQTRDEHENDESVASPFRSERRHLTALPRL